MLDDLTIEEWTGWLAAFSQDPWDERRKDDRNAVACMWAVSPYVNDDSFTPPGFVGPGYASGTEENVSESWDRLQALKKRVLNGELNRKTCNPSDG